MRQPRGSRARAAAVLSLGCAALVMRPTPAPAEGQFVQGSGDAVANVGRVVARASGLPFTVTYGGSLAHYQGTTARAESAALDLGFLGVLLTSPMGCGTSPLPPARLPKRTVADSSAGAASASRDEAGGGPIGLGREEASAQPGAKGEAAFSSVALGLDPLLSASEAKSSGVTQLVDGKERRASAAVRFGNVDLAGGVVSLRGLRWAAEQRTGPGGAVVGSGATFGLDTIVVAGLPLPTDTPLELAAAFGAANRTLAPIGLRLEPPQVTKSAGDREVRVTPLRLVVGDGTVARPVLGPLMSGVQPAREALLAAMQSFGTGKDCNLGQAGGLSFALLDVVAAAMEGSGGVDLELGGVLATTEGIDYGDPFGVVAPGLPTVAPVTAPTVRPRPPAPRPPGDDQGSSSFDSGTGTVAPSPDATPAPVETAAPAAPPVAVPTAAVLPVTRRCESTSRGRVSGCSSGLPLPASAGALGFAVLLFGADRRRGRRPTKEVAG